MEKGIQEAIRKYFPLFALVANIGLFASTGIQVGLAYNLHVPTVPVNITMGADEAFSLPGMAARDWAVDACFTFIIIGILGFMKRLPMRLVFEIIVMGEFITIMPIALSYLSGTMPAGADWIFMHHCIAGGIALISVFLSPHYKFSY